MTKRRSIDPPDLVKHKNPIPAACFLNGLLMSSVIIGYDPKTQALPESKEEQMAFAFKAVVSILNEAGLTPENVIKMDVALADMADRPLVNEYWLNLFPDEHSRPARHAHEAKLPPGCAVQIGIMAIADPVVE